jgi:hypothetical protein
MRNQTTIPRNLEAHILQLCHYVEDLYTARHTPDLIHWQTARDKAQQVKQFIMEEHS